MKGALTIAWRDFRTAFESPLAYILIAAFLAMSGLTFVTFLLSFSDLSEALRSAVAASGDATMTQRLSLDRFVVGPTVQALSYLLLGLVPLLTMRALADERRQGTMELLLTAPVPAASIVVGKFLGALGISVVAILLTIGCPLTLIAVAAPDPGPLAAGYLGLILVAAALTALGILASSLTESPVAAAFLGFVFAAACVLAGVVGSQMSSNFGTALAWLSPTWHFGPLAEGIVDTGDLAYYVIFCAGALFCALRVVDSHRWR